MRVDQVIPTLAGRDAIGTHTRNLAEALRRAGFGSEIYYRTCTPDVADLGHPLQALGRPDNDRWLLYQSSIGSTAFDVLAARPEPKLVNYHNITPAALLARWEPAVAHEVALGRRQLRQLASSSLLGVADSEYNRAELEAAGYRPTAVVPLLIPMGGSGEPPDSELTARLADARSRGGADLLYVGKVSPHKAPHDLVKMLAAYRRLYDPLARLHLVGSPLGERYGPALEGFVSRLGLAGAVSVTGSVTGAQLEAYFATADCYVSASDHEGFCVPLVEAMAHGVPVVAFGAAAVPETVGDAGLVLADKSPLHFAAAVHRVVTDAGLRAVLAGAARRRAGEFSLHRSAERFVELVTAAIGA